MDLKGLRPRPTVIKKNTGKVSKDYYYFSVRKSRNSLGCITISAKWSVEKSQNFFILKPNLFFYKYGEYFCRVSFHNQDGWINREAHYKSCSYFRSYSITRDSLGQMSVILTGAGKRKKSFSGKGNNMDKSSAHVWRMNKPLWQGCGCVVWMEGGGYMVER